MLTKSNLFDRKYSKIQILWTIITVYYNSFLFLIYK